MIMKCREFSHRKYRSRSQTNEVLRSCAPDLQSNLQRLILLLHTVETSIVVKVNQYNIWSDPAEYSLSQTMCAHHNLL